MGATDRAADADGRRRFAVRTGDQPDKALLMLATVEALRGLGGEASGAEIVSRVVETEGITEAEQSLTIKVGKRTEPLLTFCLGHARTALRRAGAVTNPARGRWTLTRSGERIVTIGDAAAALARAKKRRAALADAAGAGKAHESDFGASAPAEASLDTGPDEGPDADDEAWRAALLATLRGLDPAAFERLTQRLLRAAGFVRVRVTGGTGDGGVDGSGVLRVNLITFTVRFQCKRYAGNVGANEVRDFRGALQGRADKGLIVTTGTFTQQAAVEATRDGAITIDLIDGAQLCDLLKEHRLGVRTERVERVVVTREWFDEV